MLLSKYNAFDVAELGISVRDVGEPRNNSNKGRGYSQAE